jgi:hypothetical protein
MPEFNDIEEIIRSVYEYDTRKKKKEWFYWRDLK